LCEASLSLLSKAVPTATSTSEPLYPYEGFMVARDEARRPRQEFAGGRRSAHRGGRRRFGRRTDPAQYSRDLAKMETGRRHPTAWSFRRAEQVAGSTDRRLLRDGQSEFSIIQAGKRIHLAARRPLSSLLVRQSGGLKSRGRRSFIGPKGSLFMIRPPILNAVLLSMLVTVLAGAAVIFGAG